VGDDGPIRVLHAIANLDVGGAQEVVRSLAPALARLGCDPVVVTLRDGPLRPLLEREGIPVLVIAGRSRSLVRDPRAGGELLRIRRELNEVVRSYGTQVVQTHLLRSLDFLMLTLSDSGHRPRIVWTFHNARLDLRSDQLPPGARFLATKRRAYRLLYRQASRRAAALVAVSAEVAASVQRDLQPAAGRLVTIPNGVAIGRYRAGASRTSLRASIGVPDGALLYTCVAKLYEQKGHAVLLAAFAEAAASKPGMHLALAGDGPLANELAGRAAASGVGDRIHLLGERSDVPQLLAASDAFVLPSLWEGMPMALLEAMAAGLPVVASRVSGTEEVLDGGESGLLVEPGDAQGLATALGRLATDGTLRARLGASASQRVEARYSVDVQARAHLDLYRRCLGTRTGRAA
jgi:glycosyltransferase involved in cell wall biosynthesis